jgi:hypothetical protein
MKTASLLKSEHLKGYRIVLIALVALVAALLASCTEDDLNLSSDDSQNVENEAVSDVYFDEVDDLSSAAMLGIGSSGGRSEGLDDDRLKVACAEVTFDGNDEGGVIVIDFGDGCTDLRGNVRRGKIIITYSGRRFLPGSTVVTELEEYYINDVKIEGTRTVTNVSESSESAPKFQIVVTDGKVTWPDGTFALREADRTREWIRAANPLDDQHVVDGTASGTSRKGQEYTVEITKPLVYKRRCAVENKVFIAVEGTKKLVTDGKAIIIDYGNGECDNVVTITINGRSKEVSVKRD